MYGIVGVSALVIDRNNHTKIELLHSARGVGNDSELGGLLDGFVRTRDALLPHLFFDHLFNHALFVS